MVFHAFLDFKLELWFLTEILFSVKMTENVMIQVGQCGNQIGRRFWELALIEHAKAKSDADFDLGLNKELAFQ